MELEHCFETLEISSWLSKKELKQVYRDLIDVWHPDRFSHNKRLQLKAEEKIKEINVAYQTILESEHCHSFRPKGKKEKRRFSRQPIEILVDYSTPDKRFRSFFDMIKNISGNGVFIETNKHFPVDQKIILNFTLPRFGRLMGVSGRVARANHKGLGVELKISPSYQKLISNFI